MSLGNNVQRVVRRFVYILRSSWHRRFGKHQRRSDSNDQKLINAIACRNYKDVYPRDDYVVALNKTSFANIILSVFASIILFLTFFFTCWFSDIPFRSYSSLSIFISGIVSFFCIRKIDQFVTMRKLLKQAEKSLQDPKVRHEESCMLMISELEKNINEQIALRKKKKEFLQGKMRELCQICFNVNAVEKDEVEDIQIQNELAPFRKNISKWSKEIGRLIEQIKRLEEYKKKQKARILRSQAMAPLLQMRQSLEDVRDGTLSLENSMADEGTKTLLLEMDHDIHDMHQDLLTEIGVEPALTDDNDEKKDPPKITKE